MSAVHRVHAGKVITMMLGLDTVADPQHWVDNDLFFEFEVGDFDLTGFDDVVNIEVPTEIAEQTSHISKVKKSVKKSKRVYHKKVTPLKRGMTVSEALVAGSTPNMSRRPPTNVLLAFPHFDKCDSLLYFPNTFARHLNSTDMSEFSKLFRKHLDKECAIEFNFTNERRVSLPDFLRFWHVSNELEPDRISCAHSTKVIENKITSTVSMKLTDCQPLYTAISGTSMVKGNFLGFESIVTRKRRFEVYAREIGSSESVGQQLLQHVGTDADLVLYVQCDFVMVRNHMNKIVSLTMDGRLTSLCTAPTYSVSDDF